MAPTGDQKHRNDIYGDLDKPATDAPPAIPAATVVVLRDGDNGVEVLMLKKNSKIAFGGMWVFPGGRIDEEDYPEDRDLEAAARTAAARETHEEAGIHAEADDFVWFAHWTPPASTPKRFATFFFATRITSATEVVIDDGEIKDSAWIAPAEALRKHDAGEIDLAPPTWITLYHIGQYGPAREVLSEFDAQDTKVYSTNVAKAADGTRVAMWHGDAGYADGDADRAGERHRLVMLEGGFRFENTVEKY